MGSGSGSGSGQLGEHSTTSAVIASRKNQYNTSQCCNIIMKRGSNSYFKDAHAHNHCAIDTFLHHISI